MFSLIFTFSCMTEDGEIQSEVPTPAIAEMEVTENTKAQTTEWRLGYGTSMDGDIEPCG
jgi:hypothetical protein